MAEIDKVLNRLRNQASDARLETMETAVLAGVARHRERTVARRGLVLTSILALGVGLAASMASPQGAQAEPLASLNAVPSSAPSNLLMGIR